MRNDLQKLRDEAERRCRVSLNRGDRDSADAWERIAVAIDECQERVKHDFNLIEHRQGTYTWEAEVV